MKRKFIISSLLFVLGMFIMPNVYAEESYGKVESLSGGADFAGTEQSANVVISYSNLNLKWSPADGSRFKDGWWIGIKVTAPETNFKPDSAQVRRNGITGTPEIVKFSKIKDAETYFTTWLYVDENIKDNELFGKYEIDWNGDNHFEQNIQFKVDKASMNLEKPVGLKSVTVKGANGKYELFPTKKNSLSEFSTTEKRLLNVLTTPPEGKKFTGYKTEEGKDFAEDDELSDGLVLIAQFEDIEKESITSTPEKTDDTKNPDTSDINLLMLISLITLSGLGLGYTIKKRRFN